MMMQRRHAKNTLARQTERYHLQNHGERFQHKNAANKKQQNFLLDGHRHHANRSSECERPNIAHENFRGVRVVPEKSARRTHQGSTKNREFANLRKMLESQ